MVYGLWLLRYEKVIKGAKTRRAVYPVYREEGCSLRSWRTDTVDKGARAGFEPHMLWSAPYPGFFSSSWNLPIDSPIPEGSLSSRVAFISAHM